MIGRRGASTAEEQLELTDRDLIARCQAGDRAAFQALVARYQKRAYGIAYGVLRNPDDAMDVTQEVFVKIYRSIGQFKGDSSFFTWLYRIVVNLCIDHCRKHGRLKPVEYDDGYARKDAEDGVLPLTASTRSMHPDRAYGDRELGRALHEALATLTENHRAIIVLREVDGLSYEEISDVMQCQIGTVMSRLHHARKNLQKALQPYLEEAGSSLAPQAGRGVRKQRA